MPMNVLNSPNPLRENRRARSFLDWSRWTLFPVCLEHIVLCAYIQLIIKWSSNIFQTHCIVIVDSFPNLFIPNAHMLRHAHTAYLASLHTPSVIFEQLSLILMLPKYGVKSLTVIIPYFPTGTMERIVVQGEVSYGYTLDMYHHIYRHTNKHIQHVYLFIINRFQLHVLCLRCCRWHHLQDTVRLPWLSSICTHYRTNSTSQITCIRFWFLVWRCWRRSCPSDQIEISSQ